jgi:hypothetical protein
VSQRGRQPVDDSQRTERTKEKLLMLTAVDPASQMSVVARCNSALLLPDLRHQRVDLLVARRPVAPAAACARICNIRIPRLGHVRPPFDGTPGCGIDIRKLLSHAAIGT